MLYSIVTYFFLTLPGLILGLKCLYNRVLRTYLTCACTDHCICKFSGFIILVGVAIFIWLIPLIFNGIGVSWPLFMTAIMTSVFILSVKLMRMMLHSPEMKKLSVKTSAAESQFASTLQMIIASRLFLRNMVPITSTVIMSITSSIIMIGKSGAENLLTFGQINKVEGTSFWKKWKMMLKLIPVFTMMCLFRVLSFAIWNTFSSIMALFLPVVGFLLLKLFLPSLASLTPLDMIQGVLAEISIPSIWGTLGREKSQNIQLGMATYYLFVNSTLLIINIAGFSQDVLIKPLSPSFFILEDNINPSYLQPMAIMALVCGWISFPLYLYQIYFMESFN